MLTPLPTPDHGLLVILAYFTTLRQHKGVKWCRTRGIGGCRKVLSSPAPDLSDLGMVTIDRDPNALHKRMAETRMYLAFQCRLCGQCELSESPL
jgi:hypothetical protein